MGRQVDASFAQATLYASMLYTSMMPLEQCNWAQVPRMAAAYVKEPRRLQGLVDAVPSQSPERLLHEACSDAVRPPAAYFD
jgi:hypothetical protein